MAEGLDRYVSGMAERGVLRPRPPACSGVAAEGDDGAALSREDLFAGGGRSLRAAGGQNPAAPLVEDAQYADAGLLDFLDYLIDWTWDLPVYVLVLARPELGQAAGVRGTGRNRPR